MERKRKNKPTKPSKPYAAYPLFAHNNGQWAKKIRGRLHYFGPWADPNGAYGGLGALSAGGGYLLLATTPIGGAILLGVGAYIIIDAFVRYHRGMEELERQMNAARAVSLHRFAGISLGYGMSV